VQCFGRQAFPPGLLYSTPAEERVGNHDDNQQYAGNGIVVIGGEAHEYEDSTDGGHNGRAYTRTDDRAHTAC